MSNAAYTCVQCHTRNPINQVGGMSDTLLVRCERCGANGGISVYDDLLGRLESRHPSRSAAYAHLGELLRPCNCGGAYSASAPARCVACARPVDPAAFHAETAVRWRDNLYFGELRSPEWRKFCANCGVENETVHPAGTSLPYYICDRCRSDKSP